MREKNMKIQLKKIKVSDQEEVDLVGEEYSDGLDGFEIEE